MLRGLLLVLSALVAVAVGCGKSESESSETAPDAGENSAGRMNRGGSDAGGGTAGAATGGGDDGGEPSDGGAPMGGRGGASAGGTAGSSAGGSGGSGGVSLPDGCEGTQEVGSTSCSVRMTCDGRRLNVACTASAGVWSCSCSEAQSRPDFDFPVATGAVACEAATKACAEPDRVTGDEVCERTRTMGVLGCAVSDRCETLYDIDGVTLRKRTAWDVSCGDCENSPAFCCSCADASVIDYRIQGIDLEQGCDFMEELCKPDSTEPVGEKSCEIVSVGSNVPYSCEMSSQCGQLVELGDGTTLVLAERFRAECYPVDEKLRCICANEEKNGLTVELEMMSVDIELCRTTMGVCSGMEPLATTGARECTPNTDIALPDGCTLYVDCVQPATIAGVVGTVLTSVGAQCNLEADGFFTCHCNNRTSGPYELEAADSESACVQALDVCPTLAPTP